jgi:hypothetical protein
MDLLTLSQDLLQLVQDQLTAQGVTIPDRVYCAPGADLVFDCEQMTVHLSRIISNFQGNDSPYPAPHAIRRKSAEFYVTLVRCVPTMEEDGEPPSPAGLTTSAGVIMNDAMALRVALETIDAQHSLVPRNIPTTVGQLNTIGPLGALAATQIVYTVEVVSNAAGWVG